MNTENEDISSKIRRICELSQLDIEKGIQILIDGEWMHYCNIPDDRNPLEFLKETRDAAPKNKYRLACRAIGDWIDFSSLT